jgi:DNA-binding MarR family transcriptional regulator
MSTKSNTQIYLRFLNLTQAVAGAGTDAEVDLLALRLLETIALAHAKGKPLTVTKSMELNTIASPATLHRKLDMLREAGLIDQVFEGANRRTKYLSPTKAASQYFDHMGKALEQAAKQDT